MKTSQSKALAIMIRLTLLMMGGLVVEGASSHELRFTGASTEITPEACYELYHGLEERARGTKFERRLRRFPFLSAGPMLLSHRDSLDSDEKLKEWIKHAEGAGFGRYMKIIDPMTRGADYALASKLVGCGKLLLPTVLNDAENQRIALNEQESIAPLHSRVQRFIGRFAFWARPERHEKSIRNAREASISPSSLVQWQPSSEHLQFRSKGRVDSRESIVAALAAIRYDKLDQPMITMNLEEALYGEYAPRLLIETKGSGDAPGHPYALRTDPSAAWESRWMFAGMSVVRAAEHTLVRVHYTIWFGGPTEGVLRGLTWRVTFWRDGLPLLYEAIEADGSHYEAYAARHLPVPPTPDPDLRNAWMPDLITDTVPTLLIGAGDNRLLRVYSSPPSVSAERTETIDVVAGVSDGLPADTLNKHDILIDRCIDRPLWVWASGVRRPGCARESEMRQIANGDVRGYDDPGLLNSLLGLELIAQLSREKEGVTPDDLSVTPAP